MNKRSAGQFVWLLIVWLTIFQPVGVFAQVQPAPITLAEYRVRLTQAAQRLSQADATFKTVTVVQAELATIQSVQLPSGALVAAQPLLKAGELPDREIALARIKLVLAQLDAAANDNTTARLALLDSVLARPEFNPTLPWWQRLLRWLRTFLPEVDINPTTLPAQRTLMQVVTWTIAGVGAILLVWLLSYWIQAFLGNFVIDFAKRRQAHSGETAPLTAGAARQQATTLARSGNYRNAVRQLYLSALLTLEEQNLLHYDRSQTNREVLAHLRSQPAVQQQLQPVVETFDDVWYGIHEPDQATFDSYAQEVDALVGMAEKR